VFDRPLHQRIAQVLSVLDGSLLKQHGCLFGGGTAIALRFGEYRESVDIVFLVSDLNGYRNLRQLVIGADSVNAILLRGQPPLSQTSGIRADQYGIRTMLSVNGQPVKFEIVLEGRIELAAPTPKDSICGVSTLTLLDMVASKLLANSDRWADDGVFSRDLIDLAMMQPKLPLLRQALVKAGGAYGAAVSVDMGKAILRLQQRQGWLDHCMQVMAMTVSKALVWQRMRTLHKALLLANRDELFRENGSASLNAKDVDSTT